MAFYNKEKSDDCSAWINKNQDLYENTIDKIKSFLELGGLLHIYGVAVDNMPDRSLFLKYEDYKKYVKSYHKLIHSITGVRTLLSRSDSPFSIFSSEEDVAFFCLSWVIHGDFYETLIYQIIACYDYKKYKSRQQGLKALKNRFIYESIYLGIKTLDDWNKYHADMKEIKGWTVLSDDFVAPTSTKAEDESTILPAIDNIDMEEKKSIPSNNLTDKDNFSNILKCDAEIKDEVIRALANEIHNINTSDRIANIRLALEKKEWIDKEVSFLQFYNTFNLAIKPILGEQFRLISRGKGSNVYSANKYLLLREEKKQLSEDEEARLYEIKRICKLLNNIGTNAVKSTESEDS